MAIRRLARIVHLANEVLPAHSTDSGMDSVLMTGTTANSHQAARILVIDDEPVLRTTFQHLLESEGYVVWTAANGREGVEAFSQHPIDLVITDIVMPEMDGYATIESIRRKAPNIPIIAMSAIAGEQQMARPLTDPAFCCVAKPLDKRVLFDLVRAILMPLPNPGVHATNPCAAPQPALDAQPER